MNFGFTPSHRRGLLLLLPLVAATMLTGCGKPPGCSDSATVEAITDMMLEASKPGFDKLVSDDPRGIMAGYIKSLRVSLSEVVSAGYNADAKLNVCRATLTVNTASGEPITRTTDYAVQKTEDKPGFIVNVQNPIPFFTRIDTDAFFFYSRQRFQGEWPGTYSCSGIDGAADGPQGPFSMPVTMVVDKNMNTKIERTTKGGGVEVMTGKVGSGGGGMAGEGRNSPDDTWQVGFKGEVHGMDFTAQGQIKSGTELLRMCTLQLKLPSN